MSWSASLVVSGKEAREAGKALKSVDPPAKSTALSLPRIKERSLFCPDQGPYKIHIHFTFSGYQYGKTAISWQDMELSTGSRNKRLFSRKGHSPLLDAPKD